MPCETVTIPGAGGSNGSNGSDGSNGSGGSTPPAQPPVTTPEPPTTRPQPPTTGPPTGVGGIGGSGIVDTITNNPIPVAVGTVGIGAIAFLALR